MDKYKRWRLIIKVLGIGALICAIYFDITTPNNYPNLRYSYGPVGTLFFMLACTCLVILTLMRKNNKD